MRYRFNVRGTVVRELELEVEANDPDTAEEIAIARAEMHWAKEEAPGDWQGEVVNFATVGRCDRCGKESEELEEVTQTIPPLPDLPYGETKALALCPTCYAIVCDGADQNPG